MLSIQSFLLSSGTIPQPTTDHPHVSTPAGIWRKLESLYDLKALDEREDAIFADVVDEDGDEEGSGGEVDRQEYWREFELPADGFEAEMWGRRLADGGEEDWSGDEGVGRERDQESTIADSEDMRSSPVDAGSVRGTRSSGRRIAAGRRLAEVKQEGSVTGSGKGGSRRTSKAASPSIAGDDTEMQDAGDGQDDNEEDSDEEGADSDQDETTEDDRKSAKAARGRGGRRGGGGRGRRGRRGK